MGLDKNEFFCYNNKMKGGQMIKTRCRECKSVIHEQSCSQNKYKTKTRHTPGPWDYDWKSEGVGIFAGDDPLYHLATVLENEDGSGRDTSVIAQANARLIVAAPELLETAKDILGSIQLALDYLDANEDDYSRPRSKLLGKHRDRLASVIDKAEGKQ